MHKIQTIAPPEISAFKLNENKPIHSKIIIKYKCEVFIEYLHRIQTRFQIKEAFGQLKRQGILQVKLINVI